MNSDHHYVLAHGALRQHCFANPLLFFSLMGSDKRNGFLNQIWEKVCEFCDQSGSAKFGIDDVKVHIGHIKDFPYIIICMPPPAEVAEAHMIGIVLKVDFNIDVEDQVPSVSYFTLEKGESVDGVDLTVLAEWSKEGSHSNYGIGPEPDAPKFLAAFASRI